MSKIKVLLVDDSNFMRIVLNNILAADPDISVIDTAVNGKEAYEKAMELSPDVILLDLIMKDFDGIYALRHIMSTKPIPVVVISASGSDPDIVMQAMEEGAYDFIHKPAGLVNSKIKEMRDYIISTVRNAAVTDARKLKRNPKKNTNRHTFDSQILFQIICIGASTGGTGAIEQILTNLPSNMPVPIVIAQHMPNEFITSFAQRLNTLISNEVKVAQDGEVLKANVVYINPGNANLKIIAKQGQIMFEYTSELFKEFNFPSVDCLMQSVADAYKEKSIGVILTGMGKDGTLGMKRMFQNGAYTIAQDEETSIVWGMPKSAYESGAIKKVLPLGEIPVFLVGCLS